MLRIQMISKHFWRVLKRRYIAAVLSAAKFRREAYPRFEPPEVPAGKLFHMLSKKFGIPALMAAVRAAGKQAGKTAQ